MSITTTRPARAGTTGPKRRSRLGVGQTNRGYLFVGPFIICFLALFLVPLVYAAYLSLYRNQLVGGTVFAGFGNYARAFSDPELIGGVLRVARFFLVQVPVMLALALLAALAIDSGLLRATKLFRLAVFVPYAVPSVIAALMWGYLYGPDYGPFAQLARKIGVAAPHFLGPAGTLGSLANIVTWEFTGYNMIILYAALRSIPTDLYEAAAVDGAGSWRIAWSIKIPALRPALLLCLFFSVIGSFQLFAEPKLLQPVAPNVIDSGYTPNLYAFNLAFTSQNVNYAAAVSFMLGLVIVVASYIVLFVSNRRARS